MTDPRELLNHLGSLRDAATGGPWRWDGDRFDASIYGAGDVPIAMSYDIGPCDADDAALIVAAVNALPKLTAAVRAVLELADEADADEVSPVVGNKRLRAAVTDALGGTP